MAELNQNTTQSGVPSDDGPPNFVDELVAADVASGAYERIVTRFPPEPNGYLHIGHAKSICLNFGLARSHGGVCHLRFDDTNPTTEEAHFIDAIREDVRWLGFDWGQHEYFASDYFEQLYADAQQLIRAGLAYVDSQSLDEIRASRGNFHKPGVESPYRDRPAQESVDLLERMRAGEFEEGAHVLRAKIDMQSKDLKLRDPLMYRIRKQAHHRTGEHWSIYPMYDWAHGQGDAMEGVTHSVCTLEFQNHRNLYEWFLEAVQASAPRPKQIEFARLNLGYTVLSKRKLQQLVAGKHVDGWDDPRMPTLAGMRRRGYPPEAIVRFCDRIGVAKRDGVVDVSLLEHELREQLNASSARTMAVLRPLKVVLENFEEGATESFEVPNHPEHEDWGTRTVHLTRELWVERDDFMEEPIKKWFRLAPGREVRLRGACIIRCNEVIKDGDGQVVELRCTWDPDSRGGSPADGRKVRGTLHWLSCAHAQRATVRLYDRLFSVEDPLADEEIDYLSHLNPDSLEVLDQAWVEPALARQPAGQRFQFERLGYFTVDSDSTLEQPIFNRTIGLRDSWAKRAKL